MNPTIKPHIKRPLYIDRARPFLAKNLIKIFTGQRRTGKSYMIFQIMELVEALHPGSHIGLLYHKSPAQRLAGKENI
jgi:hypothetical protein